jgi:hypothetical protein
VRRFGGRDGEVEPGLGHHVDALVGQAEVADHLVVEVLVLGAAQPDVMRSPAAADSSLRVDSTRSVCTCPSRAHLANRCRCVPRLLGALLAVAGLSYATDSLEVVLSAVC